MSKRSKIIVGVVLILCLIFTVLIATQVNGSSVKKTGKIESLTEKNLAEDHTLVAKPGGLTDSGSIYWALAKLILALAVVIAGIYGFIYLLRRMMGQKISGKRGGNLLEVLETAYVGQKKSVSLVRFSDRTVLIGVGDNNISVLAELSQDETEKIVAAGQIEKSSSGFKNVFDEARKKLTGFQLKSLTGRLKTVDTKTSEAA